jgi:hypothetical protein
MEFHGFGRFHGSFGVFGTLQYPCTGLLSRATVYQRPVQHLDDTLSNKLITQTTSLRLDVLPLLDFVTLFLPHCFYVKTEESII